MKRKVTIGITQFASVITQEGNRAIAIQKIRTLASEGAEIICLQELFSSPYFCVEEDAKHFLLAEKIPSTFTNQLEILCEELSIVLIVSLFEKRTTGIYHNTSIVIDTSKGIIGKYRKMHIPDDPGYSEKYYFTPGDLGFPVVDTTFGKIAVLICFDQWFPEAAREVSLKGAEIIFYPTAIGWNINDAIETQEEELAAWKTIQKSHAIANGVFVVAVNRIGIEVNTEFWGNSFVINPLGSEIYSAGLTEEEKVIAIDLEKIADYRHVWTFFRDRRPEAYKGLNKQFNDDV